MRTGIRGRSSALILTALMGLSSLAGISQTTKSSWTEAPAEIAMAGQTQMEDTFSDTSLTSRFQGGADLLAKASADLRNLIETDPMQTVTVVVYTTDPGSLGRSLRLYGVDTAIGTVPSMVQGIRPIVVEVPAIVAGKVANLDAVVAITLNVVPEPPRAVDPDMENAREADSDGGDAPSPNTILAAQGHHVTDAWAAGFTGDGVRVAVLDSGIDFANPDLMDTWATIADVASPYYQWPIAFDPYSMFVYLILGATYPAADSWYVDTSFNSTSDSSGLLQDFGGRQYNVTGISSASGWYHLGQHPAPTLNLRFGGHSPGVLLTDSANPYVYDTIYVDLNDNGMFSDEKPVNVSSPLSFADYRDAATGGYNDSSWDWGDGMPDVSGGLVYFISDGVDPIPYSDVLASYYGIPNPIPGNGQFVAFMIGDTEVAGGDHGTLCASAVVAQNQTGRVMGFAPDAKIIAVGDIYFGGFWYDIYPFAAVGYDGIPDTGDEAMIASASFGSSNVDNEGWDWESRFVDMTSISYDSTVFVASTGNGGPGFGTVTPPGGSSSVISAGASTSYYSGAKTGWENGPMWNFGDVQPWSNRGPSALGNVDPDVVTVGAWASGDGAINSVDVAGTNGTDAWGIWGGTSLSAPATAGIVALIYDAYYQDTSTYPTNALAREFLMNGADNIHYDPLIMGAGLANAYRSAMMAAYNAGVRISPSAWTAGDYRGTDYRSFAHIMHAGQSDSQAFTVQNRWGSDVTVTASDGMLKKIGTWTTQVWSNLSEESPADSNRPDYLWNVSAMLPAYPGTQLVRGIVYTDFASFDPEYDYWMNSAYRAFFYNWKDLDGNGLYWNDTNMNGVVNSGELDSVSGQVEYMRFSYAYGIGNIEDVLVHDPQTRAADAVLFGAIHRYRDAGIPSTRLNVVLEFYEFLDSSWISASPPSVLIPAGGQGTITATINVPAGTSAGVYSAVLVFNDGTSDTVVPIVINVAGNSQDIAFQEDASNTSYYDNGRVYGGQDWYWRPESGDWRFYFMDIPDITPINAGTRLLVHTQWTNYPTDIDTLLFGPQDDDFSNALPMMFGPYTLSPIGGSQNMNIRAGTWMFNTATGGPEEWVSAPANVGLHEVALHNVLYAGAGPSETFSGSTGFVNVDPYPWSEQISRSTGTKTFSFTSSMNLPNGMEVQAFGVSQPTSYTSPINQNDRISFFVDSLRTGTMEIILTSSYPVDLDLYVYYELPGGGEIPVGSSTSPTADENVKLVMPVNGQYRIEVHGFSVPMPGVTFDLTVDMRSGLDLTPVNVPSGPIIANTPYTFGINYTVPDAEADYYGVVFIGPMGAPTTIELPVTLIARDTTPPVITLHSPSVGMSYRTANVPTIHVSFDDVSGAFYSGVNADSVRLIVDGRDVTSSAAIVPGSLWWNLTFLLTEGIHTAEIQLQDLAMAPNYQSLAFTFTLDDTAPTIVLTSPAAKLTNQPVIAVTGYTEPDITFVRVNGNVVTTIGGVFASIVNLAEGPNIIQIEATDPVGNTAILLKDITLDTQSPPLVVSSPTQGTYINRRTVTVTGVTEAGASVVVAGVIAAVDGLGRFSVMIAANEGAFSIDVTAKDPAGNARTQTIGVTIDTIAPYLTVSSPAEAYTNNPSLTVAGKTEPAVILTVNGAAVPVAGDGSFVTILNFGGDGAKAISVNATDMAGNMATVTKTVILDRVPPSLNIVMPTPFYQTTVPSVEVRGTTEPGATVTVNGQVAVVDSAGAFDLVTALLVPGINTIRITAIDPAGNQNQQTRDVTYIAPDIGGLQQQILALQQQLLSLWDILNDTEDTIDQLNTIIGQQGQQLNNLNNQIAILQDRLNDAFTNLNQTQSDIKTLKSDFDALGNVLTMGMVLLIVMLFVGLIGIYFAINRKISSLQGPQEDLEDIDEEEPEPRKKAREDKKSGSKEEYLDEEDEDDS